MIGQRAVKIQGGRAFTMEEDGAARAKAPQSRCHMVTNTTQENVCCILGNHQRQIGVHDEEGASLELPSHYKDWAFPQREMGSH